VKQILFPVYCITCDLEGELLCTACKKKISVPGVFFCPGCGVASEQGICCSSCYTTSAIADHVALFPYTSDHPIQKLIEQFKYNYQEDLVEIFAVFMTRFFAERKNMYSDVFCIIPVPLYKKRYVERGFNQATLLAELLSSSLGIPVQEELKRVRHTNQQARLCKKERIKNVQKAFCVMSQTALVGKHVLLVDDVFTTGSTLHECAKALKDAGVQKVSSWSLARGG
jgi:competence protein ComFC